MSYDGEHARSYEADPEHMLPPEEADAWLRKMLRMSKAAGHRGRLLDVGAGTGLLTVVMKAAGYDVTGLEPSRPMIEEALRRNASLSERSFVEGRADDATLFGEQTFDWIVSRQALCHLTDPAEAFGAWHRWLKPDGRMMLVDGFWRHSAWSESSLRNQPLASITSAAPVAEAIVTAGFEVMHAGPFGEVNLTRGGLWPDTATRYVVAARRPRDRG